MAPSVCLLHAVGCGEDTRGRNTAKPAVDAAVEGKPEAVAGAVGSDKPNIVWIVWDTVRRDRMSLYGHERATTPNVDKWAAGARVFTNCLSPASTTAPSHASMFTGLLPSEHGASNEHSQLDSRFDTIAELLRDKGGYDTYLFAANPHLSASHKLTQGFEVEEHPWSPQYAAEAARIINDKLDPRDQSSEMGRKMRGGTQNDWTLKTAGALAQVGVEKWLADRDDDRPFFVFLNYMEAHRPLIPAARFREQMLTPDEVTRSFKVDRMWRKTWEYTLGVAEYTDDEIDLTRKTYDACLLELDDMFAKLMASLEKQGALDNTIVVLTSDHGEHLGEHHMLDHQYSLYNELLEVPLIVHYPPAFDTGRDDRPVMTFDLFPTLLRLAGVDHQARSTHALDLREMPASRLRLSEHPVATDGPVLDTAKANPGFDTKRWLRSIRATTDGPVKFLCGSDGSRELYDLAADPAEAINRLIDAPDLAEAACAKLSEYLERLVPPGRREASTPKSPEEMRTLKSLGYAGGQQEETDTDGDAGEPDSDGGITDFCACGAHAKTGD
jgi:arylsulfatase A-like enzyme